MTLYDELGRMWKEVVMTCSSSVLSLFFIMS